MAEAFQERLLAALSTLKPPANVATPPPPPPIYSTPVTSPPAPAPLSFPQVVSPVPRVSHLEPLIRWGLLLAGVGLGAALATLLFHWRERSGAKAKPST